MQLAADPLADLNGAHGEALVGALCLDLEALCRAQRVREIELRRLENRLFALLAGLGAGDGDDAEHLFARVIGTLKVAALLARLDVDRALA